MYIVAEVFCWGLAGLLNIFYPDEFLVTARPEEQAGLRSSAAKVDPGRGNLIKFQAPKNLTFPEKSSLLVSL